MPPVANTRMPALAASSACGAHGGGRGGAAREVDREVGGAGLGEAGAVARELLEDVAGEADADGAVDDGDRGGDSAGLAHGVLELAGDGEVVGPRQPVRDDRGLQRDDRPAGGGDLRGEHELHRAGYLRSAVRAPRQASDRGRRQVDLEQESTASARRAPATAASPGWGGQAGDAAGRRNEEASGRPAPPAAEPSWWRWARLAAGCRGGCSCVTGPATVHMAAPGAVVGGQDLGDLGAARGHGAVRVGLGLRDGQPPGGRRRGVEQDRRHGISSSGSACSTRTMSTGPQNRAAPSARCVTRTIVRRKRSWNATTNSVGPRGCWRGPTGGRPRSGPRCRQIGSRAPLNVLGGRAGAVARWRTPVRWAAGCCSCRARLVRPRAQWRRYCERPGCHARLVRVRGAAALRAAALRAAASRAAASRAAASRAVAIAQQQ